MIYIVKNIIFNYCILLLYRSVCIPSHPMPNRCCISSQVSVMGRKCVIFAFDVASECSKFKSQDELFKPYLVETLAIYLQSLCSSLLIPQEKVQILTLL